MNFLKNYIKFHLNILHIIYNRIIVKTDKKVFAFLFNIKAMLMSSPSKILWDGSNFVVSDKEHSDFSYKIRHQKQCNMAYEYGIDRRAESLANCYFLREIDFKTGDIFIDCGANVGDLKIWFDLNHKDIEYVGFEPSPIEFNCLKANIQSGTVHNLGLWNKEGELEFYVSSQGADSSLIQPKSYDKKVITKVARLEEFIDKPIKLLKLEAEGAEPEILQGLGQKLKLVQYISADLGYERGIESESTLAPVTNYLLSKGFELIDVSHDRICALYKNTHFN